MEDVHTQSVGGSHHREAQARAIQQRGIPTAYPSCLPPHCATSSSAAAWLPPSQVDQDTTGDVVGHKKGCRCKKSKCLKKCESKAPGSGQGPSPMRLRSERLGRSERLRGVRGFGWGFGRDGGEGLWAELWAGQGEGETGRG